MSFLYSLFLKLLYPTSLAVVMLLLSTLLRKREMGRRIFFWLAVAILLVCGNGWVVEGLTRHLEREYPSPNPDAKADCIIILSGGVLPGISPRQTIEVDDAGDRVLYGAHLFRQGKAPRVICTGNVATGCLALRPAADDMAELLEMLSVPKEAVITETLAENTHQHAVNLYPLLREKGFKSVLLVTSAAHMPRSIGAFRKHCPGIQFTPAPTDFRIARLELPWNRELVALMPMPANLKQFSETMHEYIGIAYYRLRGWM